MEMARTSEQTGLGRASGGAAVTAMHLFVVGDRFRGFVHDDRVTTVSALCTAVAAGAYDELEGSLLLCRGQGVSPFDRAYVEATIDRRGLQAKLRFAGSEPTVAPRDVAHKQRLENVLLADMRRTGVRTFRADLRVHADNELLLDHQTGEHIQGMIVVEAARQMFLAAFEVGYRHRWPLHNFYVVWNSVQLAFESFLFPLPAEVVCELSEVDVESPESLRFDMSVELHQLGRRVASGTIGFTSFEYARIASIERHKAGKALGAAVEWAASADGADDVPLAA
jgi:hypothetical protein